MQVKSTEPLPIRFPAGRDQTLSYRVWTCFEDLAHLKDEWNDLSVRAGDVLCSYDWCELWWKHFCRWRQLEIHTLHDQGRLVAVLPLFCETIHPGGVRLRTVRVLGCDYTIGIAGLAIEPAYAERFTGMVLESLDRSGPWDMLEMAPLRSYTRVVDPIAQACSRHSSVQTVILGKSDGWDTAFHLPGTYEAFENALTSKVRSDTRRRERKLRETHRVEFAAAASPDQIGPALEALIDLHQKTWIGRGQPGQLRDLPVRQFHHELAQRLSRTGQLVLLTLKVDDQIVSAGYGYRHGRRIHLLFVGHSYEERWQEYGLGRMMHCHVIRHAIEHGCTMLEDGRGIFDYKLRLGGILYGERSLVALHRGWSTRLRFWTSLRAAYVIQVLYSRLWIDTVAPRLGIKPEMRHFNQRYYVLAQLFRRTRFRLLGGPAILETRCLQQAPPEYQGTDDNAAGRSGTRANPGVRERNEEKESSDDSSS